MLCSNPDAVDHRGRKTLEALKARLALRVDLATVERLALVLPHENFVGRIQLSERVAAFGSALLASGCSFFACRRKAFLISA